MTKQTWTAVVSAILFVVCAAVIAMVPVNYVVWAPGSTTNLLGASNGRPLVAISGVRTYPTSGDLMMTTVAVTRADAELSLPEALYAYWMPDREVLPREIVYPPGSSIGEVQQRETEQMDMSQSEAVAAAIQAAGLPIQRVPIVESVATAGPANGKIQAGDLLVKVDGKNVTTPEDVASLIEGHRVGDEVKFTIDRHQKTTEVDVVTSGSNTNPGRPVVGITMGSGYRHSAVVEFNVDQSIGGPSGGLMFALAVYDKLSPKNLVTGLRVAGSGMIDGTGKITSVGAIDAKISAAERDGASLFLVPESNCADVSAKPRNIRLVKVSGLGQAIDALGDLQDPAHQAEVKGCS